MKTSTIAIIAGGGVAAYFIYQKIKSSQAQQRAQEVAAGAVSTAVSSAGSAIERAIQLEKERKTLEALKDVPPEKQTEFLAASGIKLGIPNVPKGFVQYIVLNRVSSLSDEAGIAEAEAEANMLWQDKTMRLKTWPEIRNKGAFWDKNRNMYWKWNSVNQVWEPAPELAKAASTAANILMIRPF